MQRYIRNFAASPPAKLQAMKSGKQFLFEISQTTGKVAKLPDGVFSWAKGFSWNDLKTLLEKDGYKVVVPTT